MSDIPVRSDVFRALEGRNPSYGIRSCIKAFGMDAVLSEVDRWLGDFPSGAAIRKAAVGLGLTGSELNVFADSVEESTRRVGRLLLLEESAGVTEDSRLNSGLSDSCARIRSDAVRFVGTGIDRTRLYNRLIRMIREDPDSRVRSAAGRRLAESFADLYSVDFEGLPPLSRMLILDALAGSSRADEERAESLLSSDDTEAVFRAARCLLRWGTLRRHFESGSEAGAAVLRRSAEVGVSDYLESAATPEGIRPFATELAGRSGRDDLVRRIAAADSPAIFVKPPAAADHESLEKLVLELSALPVGRREDILSEMNIEGDMFRKSVERSFPPPETDISSSVLFDMARIGHWTGWTPRAAAALGTGDPDLRIAALAALSVLSPDSALEKLPGMLSDPVERVRLAAARCLASLPSGGGCPHIAEFLTESSDLSEQSAVLEGMKQAGGAATARCIIDGSATMSPAVMGILLASGLDDVGVELLTDEFTRAADLGPAMKNAGPEAGRSLLKAWPNITKGARKRLISWIRASGWPDEALIAAGSGRRSDMERIRGDMAALDGDDRTALIEPLLENAGGRNRRRLRSLMKG